MKKYYSSGTKRTYIEQMEAGGKNVPEEATESGNTKNTFWSWKGKLRDEHKRDLSGGKRQKPDMEYPRKMGNENIRQKRYSGE